MFGSTLPAVEAGLPLVDDFSVGGAPSLTVSSSSSSVSAADPLLDRAVLPVSPVGGGMACVSSVTRPISPYKMPIVIIELLVLLVFNRSMISRCCLAGTVMMFSVLVAVALAKSTTVEMKQPAMAILLSISIVVAWTKSVVR